MEDKDNVLLVLRIFPDGTGEMQKVSGTGPMTGEQLGTINDVLDLVRDDS